MSAILFPDGVDDRADQLADANLNGLRLALVSLPAGPDPDHADLELRFHNDRHLASLLAEIAAEPARAGQIFRVRGGSRMPAGPGSGQVRVHTVSGIDATRVNLRIAPVGDYSTYTLELVWNADRIDPFFSSLEFRFRPGCFTNDCAPRLDGRPRPPGPEIDYLAKDYDSLRHTLMTAMAQRVPAWSSTSEADHDQVLIDLFAAAADELSDHQDRVMAEAYLATARKRISLARHARLMDYHLSEGHQASTWLVVEILDTQPPFALADPLHDQELVVSTAAAATAVGAVSFSSRQRGLPPARWQWLDPRLNRLRLHTWRDAQPALRAGSTSADLVPLSGLASQADAEALRDRVRDGFWREMVLVEMRNPLTGAEPGRNPRKRQLLRLGSGADAAEALFDPVTLTWLVRVHWREQDSLRFDYSFTTFCGDPPAPVHDVSLFFGNALPVYEGRPFNVRFHEPGSLLPGDTPGLKHRHFQRMDRFGDGQDWVLAELPDEGPLAYRSLPPGLASAGEEPARSTLRVRIEPGGGGAADTWDEVESLVHSDDSPENGEHFMVETDERRRSVLRFGNGRNGRLLPPGAVIHAVYQIGGGHQGNVGADQLTHPSDLSGSLSGVITATRNPFDVTDGRDPEPAERIRRHAPEAFRARQLRAVTLADYAQRAEEVPGVSRAVARYAWSGSWRTVRVVIDPQGSTELTEALRADVAAHLEAVRLIGEDLELRPPRYVPLDVRITVCADPTYWREDLRYVLEQEFSDGWTADGRQGFFHPDRWTFGQSLHRSMLEGRLHQVTGIRHVAAIAMKRFNAPTPGGPGADVLEMGFDEVLLLSNDPSHLERGLIRFDLQGGRP
ncbi:MAG: hypothetical protein ER33_05015 [Cyanobium sp. CACIAM 14]|nr:MAG: hypothetical protein ER33_05015 [Cyanobium sp. CACIAM 14]